MISRNDAAGQGAFRVAGEIAATPPELALKLACMASALWSLENGCLSDFFQKCGQLSIPPSHSAEDGWGKEQAVIQPACMLGNPRKDVRFIVFGTGSPDRNGHIWPGGLMGGAMNATDKIWEFFEQHPR